MIMSTDENTTQIETNSNNKIQRKRSVFDFEQIRQLEYVFDQITHYPDLSLRQHLTHLTQLQDKKIQIWFQNRRAKWRKQHQLGHFGGLHELTVDRDLSFVPAPKSNFILTSPSTTISNHTSIQQQQQQQFEYFFYLAFQTALAKANENPSQACLMKRHDSIHSSRLINSSIYSPNNGN